jgi:hypothetical protein
MILIARELEYILEGLKAAKRSVKDGEADDATFIIDNLLIATSRLIDTCKIQRKRPLSLPDQNARIL